MNIARLHLTIALLLSCSAVAQSQSPSESFRKLAEEAYEDVLRTSPEIATMVGRHEYGDRWTDYSAAGLQHRTEALGRYLDAFRSTAAAQLTPAEKLTLDIFLDDFNTRLEQAGFIPYFDAVNHYRGIQGRRGYGAFDAMPRETERDYENVISRVKAMPALVDQTIRLADEALEKGFTTPRVSGQLVIPQLEMQIADEPLDSPILKGFREFPNRISEDRRSDLRERGLKAYRESFLPAWTKFRNYLKTTYIPKTRHEIALTSIPNGKHWYAQQVRRFTTTDLEPTQIHQLGLDEVERIQAEMAAIRKELGFEGGPLEFRTQVLEAPERRYASADEMIRHAREVAKRVDPELPKLFRVLPRMPYGVKPVPDYIAATSASHYRSPASDGSRTGMFFMRTYEAEKQPRFRTEALVLHETVPGHHLQRALQVEMQEVPKLRTLMGYSAYTEGWGLYAESLGEDLGVVYQTPHTRYGKLHSELFRACRLVVDTGMHALGWSRQRAINFMLEQTGTPYEHEINRYLAMPAQALAYKVGELKIKELRRLAEGALGQRFDIREFHDVVLRNGAMPLNLLEREVRSWLEGK